jgi:sugar lactone lactonase YvrE
MDDDAAGGASVTIEVNSPPSCSSVAPSPATLWPATHGLLTTTLAGATDPDGDPVTLTVTGVTQDEPVNGFADGNTAPDGTLVPGRPDQVNLRAERSSTGDGRVYRVAFTVADDHGGSCTSVADVTVVKGLGTGPAVDSGLLFDSLL